VSVEDFEKGRLDRLSDHAWLTDDTISRGSWCYTENLRIKPLSEVLHDFIDIVSKNGCLLLNISPKADGSIPPEQQKVLLGLGAWLGTFGEAIYETRPWVVFGEGPTRLKKSGHFVGSLRYTAADVRFTTRGNTLYAIFLGKPKATATIASLATGAGLCGGQVKAVSLLGTDAALKHTQDDKGLHVTFPAKLPHDLAVALKIEGLQLEGFKPDLSIRFQKGKARLGASKATLHGPGIATESKDAGKPNIGFWDDPSATASWEVRFPQAGAYKVRGRFAARAKAAFSVRVGKAKLDAQSPATGDWEKFQNADLGTITVDAPGRLEVKLVPTRDAWAAINLAWLELTKAEK